MSGQALFWSVHHWSVHCQIMAKANPRRPNLTFGCVTNGAGVDRLANSKLGKACHGSGNGQSEKHLDLDGFDVLNM